jgi:hypothetical protein
VGSLAYETLPACRPGPWGHQLPQRGARHLQHHSLTYLPAGGCGTLANLTEQVAGPTRAIGVNVGYTSCSCATAAAAAQTTYTFQPTQAGTYYLRFIGNNAYIVDTLVVK